MLRAQPRTPASNPFTPPVIDYAAVEKRCFGAPDPVNTSRRSHWNIFGGERVDADGKREAAKREAAEEARKLGPGYFASNRILH